ncbi:aarF domain-containing protein kinase 1-like [Littorina saxatilis]|uniref:ABC1 atypical kinase-like domain-containing protein n=1 Tax=Littorina saxatilis TaxID=31220 RepID=A0AAN9BFS1_9CAEN
MSRRVWRGLKVVALGATVGGTAVLLKNNDWEVSTVGVVRFGRAAWACAGIAFDYKWTLGRADADSPDYPEIKSQIHQRSAERLREMCKKNGGAFIKVGQHIGSLEYLLPKEYVRTMKIFHNEAPQSELKELYKVIEDDLGEKVEDLFTSFEPEPLGAASLAQVHKATLKDGTVVAVKVQHPRVKAHSYIDIKTMELLVHGIAWLFPGFQYAWLAEETKKNLPVELDFVNEGQNCERVARQLHHFDFLKIPQIYWELSSPRVLTMEFCEGGKVDDLAYMQQQGISVDEVSRRLGQLYSEMIFVQGYVHCDPHPGNVLVNRTPRGTQLVLLDHGLYQTLTDDFRVHYSKMWLAMINADVEGMKRHADAMNVGHMFGLFACMLTARSWKALQAGISIHEFTEAEGSEIKTNVSNYLYEISDILNRVPRQLLLILKTNDVLRGIEAALKIRANATSFINMSRSCVRAVAEEKQKHCDGIRCVVRTRLSERWELVKISVFEFCLWLVSSPVFRWISSGATGLHS